jgi:preprotein translocase subunit SecG
MFLITGCIILSLGIFMVFRGRKKNQLLKKYEQANRSSDGSIQFGSIQLSRTHGANKNLNRVITIMGVFTALFGLIFIGYGLDFFYIPFLNGFFLIYLPRRLTR